MSRVLHFTQIADSRFCEDLQAEIDRIDEAIERAFYPYQNIILYRGMSYECEFPDGIKQIRKEYSISKNTRKLTWKDVYKKINNIKPVPYNFI